MEKVNHKGKWYLKSDTGYREIIATTDPELNLPQPSKAFIEKYCMVGGIDEVDVEYQANKFVKDGISRPVMDDGALKDYKGDWEYSPKVTSNNEIIIHSIEEKMYSKDEVVQLFRDYQNAKAKQILDGSEPIIPLEWIKENLN